MSNVVKFPDRKEEPRYEEEEFVWPPMDYSPMSDLDWFKIMRVLVPIAFALGFLAGKVL